MKKIFLLIILLVCSSIYSQTFNVNYLHSFLYLSGIGALDLSNNYFDRHFIKNISEKEIEKISTENVPSFDRYAIYQPYSKKLKSWSDYSVYATIASSIILSYDDNYFKDNLIVFGEILLTQSAVCKWTKTFSRRFRPFVYDKNVSLNLKKSRNARHSFYSMHSSTAFAAATFAYFYQQKKHGGNYYKAFFLFGSATLTSFLRVQSENHFPSDVIIGAIAGSSISYLFCKIHTQNKIKFSLDTNKIEIILYF